MGNALSAVGQIGKLAQGFMGGSKSQSESMSESIARQAMFFPTQAGIEQSLIPMRQYAQQAQQFLDPYGEAGTEAMRELRLLTGLKPRDPLSDVQGSFESLISSIRAPEGAILRTDTGAPMFEQINYRGTPGSLIGSGVDYGEYWKGLPDKIGHDQFRGRPAQPGSQGAQFGMSPNLIGKVGLSPETFTPKTQADEDARYVFSSASNTDYVSSPLRRAREGINAIINSEDPEERQSYYDNILSYLDSSSERIDQVVKGVMHEDNRAVELEEVQSRIAQIKNDFMSEFDPEAPKPLTNEEIEQKVTADPGYRFRFDQGQKAVEQSTAARGLLKSGRFAKELERFGSNLAAQQYQQTVQNLASIAGIGMPALQQSANISSGLGAPHMQAIQDMNRAWTMSPWTQMSMSRSISESSSR